MNSVLSTYYLSRYPTLCVRHTEDQRVLLRFYTGVVSRTPLFVAITRDSEGLHLSSVDVFKDPEYSTVGIWNLFKQLLLTELNGEVELIAYGAVEFTECPQGVCHVLVGATHIATVNVDESSQAIHVIALPGFQTLSESITVLVKSIKQPFRYVTKQLRCKYRESILRNYCRLAEVSKTQLKQHFGCSGTFREFLDTLDEKVLSDVKDVLALHCNRKPVHVVTIYEDLHTYVAEMAGYELRTRTGLKLAELKDFSTIVIQLDPQVKILTTQWLIGYLKESIVLAGSDWAFINRYKFVGFDAHLDVLERTKQTLFKELFD